MRQAAFAVTMLLSGFAGISYEILYGRIFADIVGDQFAVSASILITFLLGIGVGSIAAHRLWRWLWLIEAAIGAYGLVVALGVGAVDGAFTALVPLLPAGVVGSILFCIPLLVVPAFLIGCSVPLFAGYFERVAAGAGFSRVYAVYNFGAALTAFAIEFVLVRALGIRGAVVAIASVNGVVALSLAVLFARAAHTPPPPSGAVFPLQTPRRTLVALTLISIASAVFQLFMVRLGELILGPFRETFAIVLSIVLLGLALGAWRVERRGTTFDRVALWALCGAGLLAAAVEHVVWLYAAHYPSATGHAHATGVLLKWAALALLMGLPATAFGATIPALLHHDGSRGRDVARRSGEMLFVSSVANALGFLLMTLVLHRVLEYRAQLFVVVLLIVAAALVHRPRAQSTLAWAMALFTFSFWGVWSKWNEDFLYMSYTSFKSSEKLVTARATYERSEMYRGAQDVFSVLWKKGNPYLFINGYVSIPLNNPSEMMVGAIGSMFSPAQDKALVLGLGSGGTASVVGMLFDKTDVVEINPVITDNIAKMARWNFDIANNRNVNIVVDDGIHYMKKTENRYSLILNTVTTPIYFSSSKLYTKDFFETVRQRLAPDGVYLTWIDARIGDRGANIVLRTLQESFPRCSMLYVKSAYFLLMCSDGPIAAKHPELAAQNPTLTKKLMAEHGIDARWLATHFVAKDAFQLLPQSAAERAELPVNTVDEPELEFEMARLRETGMPALTKRLLAQMRVADVWDAVAGEPPLDVGALVVHAEKWLGADSDIARRWLSLVTKTADGERRVAAARLSFAQQRADVVNDPAAHYQLALVHKKQGRLQNAITELNAALALNPRLNDAEYMLGRCYEDLGDLDAALLHYQAEERIDPKDPDLPRQLERLAGKRAAAAQR